RGRHDDGPLCGGIAAAVDLAPQPRDRREEYDPGRLAVPASYLQERHGFAGAEPQPTHVDGKQGVKILHWHGFERADPEQAGGADEAIEVPEATADRLEDRRHAQGGSHVADFRVEPSAGRQRVLAQGLEPPLVAIECQDRPALFEQALGRTPADAGGRSGDRCNSAHAGISLRSVNPRAYDGKITPLPVLWMSNRR